VLIPLAERCREVTGVDVSPAMLEEARRNCEAAGVSQVRLIRSDDNLSAIGEEFDFVHSPPCALGEDAIAGRPLGPQHRAWTRGENTNDAMQSLLRYAFIGHPVRRRVPRSPRALHQP
jgi:hypothetical protein